MTEKRERVRRASDKAMIDAAKLLLSENGAKDEMLTRIQAKKLLGVSLSTLDRLAKKRRLRPVLVPSPTGGPDLIRYSVAEIEKFRQQHQT